MILTDAKARCEPKKGRYLYDDFYCVRSARSKSHELVPVYVPPRRITHEFLSGRVDAAAKDQGNPITEDGYFYADNSIFFHTAFFTLTESGIKIEKP